MVLAQLLSVAVQSAQRAAVIMQRDSRWEATSAQTGVCEAHSAVKMMTVFSHSPLSLRKVKSRPSEASTSAQQA